MKATIFIRSCKKDIDWLEYCLSSIDKYKPTDVSYRVVTPMSDIPEFKERGIVAIACSDDKVDGYMEQQVTKLHADTFISAEDDDLIIFVDSDCVLSPTFQLSDIVASDGRIYWFMTPYTSDLGGASCWKDITSKAVGFEVKYEYMRRFPFALRARHLRAFREYMEKLHKMPTAAYVRQQPKRNFSEFNALGGFLHRYCRDDFIWQDTTRVSLPEPCIRQFWSWGGITKEVFTQLENLGLHKKNQSGHIRK